MIAALLSLWDLTVRHVQQLEEHADNWGLIKPNHILIYCWYTRVWCAAPPPITTMTSLCVRKYWWAAPADRWRRDCSLARRANPESQTPAICTESWVTTPHLYCSLGDSPLRSSCSNCMCENIQDSRFLCFCERPVAFFSATAARVSATVAVCRSRVKLTTIFLFFWIEGVIFFCLCVALRAVVPRLKGSASIQEYKKTFSKILTLSNVDHQSSDVNKYMLTFMRRCQFQLKDAENVFFKLYFL